MAMAVPSSWARTFCSSSSSSSCVRRLSARHPGFPKPGPPRPQPPVVYDPQKPLRSVSGGEALGHGRWARPARAQAAADRLCVRRPGTPSH
uniref:Uncharacterized protein n=1 Tax=Rangifer tarandus platyrhynchus TaxID=3082113 RepID=A0ACB0E3L1_RANTA|nr:unnamed protein product [Rangifer tarandus platyrhynchus]